MCSLYIECVLMHLNLSPCPCLMSQSEAMVGEVHGGSGWGWAGVTRGLVEAQRKRCRRRLSYEWTWIVVDSTVEVVASTVGVGYR